MGNPQRNSREVSIKSDIMHPRLPKQGGVIAHFASGCQLQYLPQGLAREDQGVAEGEIEHDTRTKYIHLTRVLLNGLGRLEGQSKKA